LRRKYISQLFKKIGIKLAASSLRGLVVLKNGLVWFYLRLLQNSLRKFGGFLIDWLLLPSYKGYLFCKRQLQKIYHPTGNIFWDILTHRYTIHGIIILLGLLIVTNNIQARVAGFRDENYGRGTILYALVGDEELNLIEETATSITSQPSTYLGYQSNTNPISSSLEEGEKAETSPLTQGGAALVKPEISAMAEGETRGLFAEETYIVQEGDTVASIADRFGVSIYTILWENNLTERSYIRPGDKLVILPATGVKHKVKRGETLAGISKQYGVDQEQIIAYNDLMDEEGIQIGQELFIPGGKKIPMATPANRSTIRSYVGSPPPSAVASTAKLQWPTSGRRITQYYRWRHSGLDIDGDYSSPIYAAEAGMVVKAKASGYNGGYGKMVIIDHGNGLQTLYGHLNQLFVSLGDSVSRGQTIGMMGTTGRSTGTHLHFEVRVNGARLNPLSYIR
jgi:murein DD-endopeptidase MepM/ murein hydrolase activator NlpD